MIRLLNRCTLEALLSILCADRAPERDRARPGAEDDSGPLGHAYIQTGVEQLSHEGRRVRAWTANAPLMSLRLSQF